MTLRPRARNLLVIATMTAMVVGGQVAMAPWSASAALRLAVTDSPAFTSADHTTFVVGTAGSFAVTTSGGGAGTAVSHIGTLPSGVSFTPSGSGATIAGTPAAGAGGTYPITITASDGVSTDAVQGFTLTVNEPPRITSSDHVSFAVGSAGSFTVTTAAGFPAATTITRTGSLPAGISMTDNGDGTATLGGTPTEGGAFPITITASNGVAPDATQPFTLTVNQAPNITSADHTTLAVGSAGTFTVTTSPAAVTVTRTGTLPSGITFTDNGDGTASLAGTPAAGTGGTYALTFTATNPTGFSAQSFTLTVNQLASITSASHATFTLGTPSSFTITTTAGYPPATTVTNSGVLPSGVSFTDNGDGTATLSGTAAAGTAGSYPLTITATNAAGSRQQAFTLTVQSANQSPVITSADHATFALGTPASFTITTTAGNPATTTITKTGAFPTGLTFTDNGDGTATLAGTPTTAGVFPITITASNGASADAQQSFTLMVTKTPVITVPADFSVVESPQGSGTATVPFTVTATGVPAPTIACTIGTAPVTSPVTLAIGSHLVDCTARNSVGSDSGSFTVTVNPGNHPPAPSVGGPYTVAEGQPLTLDASGTTDGDGDALTYSWDVNGDSTFGDATGAAPTLSWTQLVGLHINDGPASFSVKVRVSDGHVGGTVTSSASTLSVTNTPATAAISGPADVLVGSALTVGLSATDASPVDQAYGFDYTVSWGDGATEGPLHGGSPLSRGHTYAAIGVYTVTLTATDKDGGVSAAVTKTITVGGTRLVTSTCGSGADLVVGGTSAGDTIKVASGTSTGLLAVTVNGVSQGTFTPTSRLLIHGQGGNDTIAVDSRISISQLIYGGAGDDSVSGGNGDGVQIGGDGNDTLSTGNGRDILIGGAGGDTLKGANGDDVLIAGSTSYDAPSSANQASLCAMAKEWGRSDAAYATRIAHLTGSTSGGLNGSNLLTTSGSGRSVFDDTSKDTLTGGLGQDWYLLNVTGGSVADKSDATTSETTTDV